MDDDTIAFGREVLRLEAEAVTAQAGLLDGRFAQAVQLILGCEGHVVATGMGKSGIIAQKISATLASTGTPSFYLHPAEAILGDLGRVGRKDVVLAISRSGDTEELKRLITPIKKLNAKLIGITCEPESALAKHADCLLLLARAPEACPIGLAPTTSTTAQLALGDALAMAVSKRRNFRKEDFAAFHPGGALGRSLMKVSEVMRSRAEWPPAAIGTTTREALVDAGGLGRRPGALVIVDAEQRIAGLLTDGDIRRGVLKDGAFLDQPIERTMTKRPTTVRADQLAAEAWSTMKSRNFDEVPVVDAAGKYLGLLDVQDLLEAGIT
jgi:arabinose-5-phosphate isomerase